MNNLKLGKPRLHPNGFIQCDFMDDPTRRLHIWSQDLPQAQKVSTQIHNHTFSFESQIILGTLRHTVYSFYRHDFADYKLWEAIAVADSEDTVLRSLNIRGFIVKLGYQDLPVGASYIFEASQFHTSEAVSSIAATIMHKTFQTKAPAGKVAIPIGVTPDNDFRRDQYPAEQLQKVVDQVVEFVPGFGKRFFND